MIRFELDMPYFEPVTFVVIFLVKAIIPVSTWTMPIPHPRRRVGGGRPLLDQMGHVWDWAPPGWYWEALPTGGAAW